MVKELNEKAAEIYAANKEKGFWDSPIETGTRLMLIVSELGEAIEAHRKGRFADLESFEKWEPVIGFKEAFEKFIKDTYEDEIADTMIRCFDLSGGEDVSIGDHLELKLKYNATREHKHGKKY